MNAPKDIIANPDLVASTEGHTFTCFGRLPTEIRLMIWAHTCQHVRHLNLMRASIPTEEYPHVLQDFWQRNERDVEQNMFRHVTSTPPPAILHVCIESRGVGLKHYQLSFGRIARVGMGKFFMDVPSHIPCTVGDVLEAMYPTSEDQRELLPVTQPPHIYVSFETDIIIPRWELQEDVLPALGEFPIQRIAFHICNSYTYDEFCTAFENQDSVKEVFLYEPTSDSDFTNRRKPLQFEELDMGSTELASADLRKAWQQWEEHFDGYPADLQDTHECQRRWAIEEGRDPEDFKLPEWHRPVLKAMRVLETSH
jgi:hypothetical protein